jgi:hypothetical protein
VHCDEHRKTCDGTCGRADKAEKED